MTDHKERPFIRAQGRELEVGETGLSVDPEGGEYDDLMEGHRYVSLSLYVEPADPDEAPRLVINDADLFIEGTVPEALDGLRLRVDLDEGDEGEPSLPWIRPGSLTGVSVVTFQPRAHEDAGRHDTDDARFLEDILEISLDRTGDTWRVEVKAGYQSNTPRPNNPHFHAVFFSELEIEDWGDDWDDGEA